VLKRQRKSYNIKNTIKTHIYPKSRLHNLWQPDSGAVKWRENEKMERKWRENEEMERE